MLQKPAFEIKTTRIDLSMRTFRLEHQQPAFAGPHPVRVAIPVHRDPLRQVRTLGDHLLRNEQETVAKSRRLRQISDIAFDFDDLIYQTVQLLAEHEDVREFYQNKYRYLLVDEYQDTSVAQFRLVSLLTGPEKNICVVGDDDQSIYRFRGATIENILNFERIFPGTKTIRLEQNYRSTSNILNAANCVIQHNTERKGKTLWTDNGEGDKVQVYTAENEQDEASHIADVIGQHLKEGGHLADHAILYRMNAQSAPIESYFTRAGIPHKIVGGQRFNDRKEVKDIHSYMSIVANPRDDVRLRRIINEPARKIGATTVDVIADLAGQQGVSMLDIISHADQYAKLSRAVMPLLSFGRSTSVCRILLPPARWTSLPPMSSS